MPRLSMLLVLGVACQWPALAHAEVSSTSIAQSLFADGRALLDAGHVHAACAKFAESQRVEPAGGTLLNLAFCHEREGRLATAHTEFGAALAQAMSDGRKDRETMAREHIDALEPRLPRVVIDIDPVHDLTLTIDGEPLRPASFGTPIAVDPGAHEIVALAPSRYRRSVRVHVVEGRTSRVTIPPLLVVDSGVQENVWQDQHQDQDQKRDDARPNETLRGVGIVATGLGATTVVTASLFFLVKMLSIKQTENECLSGTEPPAADKAFKAYEAAQATCRDQSDGRVMRVLVDSTILWGIGAAAMTGGLVLVHHTAKASPRSNASVELRVTPGSVALVGTF